MIHTPDKSILCSPRQSSEKREISFAPISTDIYNIVLYIVQSYHPNYELIGFIFILIGFLT